MNYSALLIGSMGLVMTTIAGGCASGPKPENIEKEPEHVHHEHKHNNDNGNHEHGDHRFENPEEWVEKFESPERDAWQRPDKIIEQLSLDPKAHVAEIGSGTGYFATRLARKVPQGRVWAIDVEPKMVRYLGDRAQKEHLGNLFSALGTYDDPLIPTPVDWILMANTYHHIEDRSRYLSGLRDYLKPDGRIVIVEFKKGDLPHGPPDEMKLSPSEVQAEFQAAGFKLNRTGIDLEYHYTQIFKVKL